MRAPCGVYSKFMNPNSFQPQPVPGIKEIREILVKRIDQQKQAGGIVVGVIEPTGRRIVAYGNLANGDPRPLDGDTIFEIGSISKVFTSLLLADMVNLTAGEIKDAADLFAFYSADDLYQFLSSYTLPRDPGSEIEYSNLGAGLLGHVLACRAGTDYETLLKSRITQPLNMPDTGITFAPSRKQRMASGHKGNLLPATQIDWDPSHALAGAGALRSSANDMLTFLEAFLGYKETPLAPAMKAMLEVRRLAGQMEIGLGWLISSTDGRHRAGHNGGTGGFRSFVGYDPKGRIGVVVLSNAFTLAGV